MEHISKKDSLITLDFLLKASENQYFERKGRDTKHTEVANEIIGMLNADGGILVYGISSDGKIEDLSLLDEAKLDHYRKVISNHIKPPANVELEEILLAESRLIFLFHVSQDYERLFARSDSSEAVYLRVADSCMGPLSRDEVRKLEYDKSIRSFEDQTCDNFEFNDFRISVLDFYKKKLKFTGSFDDLLVSRNLAIQEGGSYSYKNSAVLLFAKNPDKHIPSAYIRYVRYRGVEEETGEKHNVIKDEIFHDNIPRLFEILKRFIYASLRDYFYLNVDKGQFIKVSEYPKEAYLEGLVNALCHRSYNVQGNCIYIKHFDDRLEISNSGPLPAQVTVENIRSARYSRNPRVARVLSDLGYVRELNEGVKRIYESMKKSLLADPEYKDEHNIVTLILRNKVTDHEDTISGNAMKLVEKYWIMLNKTEKVILLFLFENNRATIAELSKHLGITIQAVRNNLNNLIDLDILERISEKLRDKNALFVFKKS